MLAYFADVHADRVGKQDERQPERREDHELGRAKRKVPDTKAMRADHEAQQEERANQGKRESFDDARQERRDDDHQSDQRDRGNEMLHPA